MNQNKRTYQLLNVFANVFIYVFLGLSIILLCLSITSKKDKNDAINIFGYQMRIVISPSMEKNENTYNDIKKFKIKDLKVKSLIFIKKVSDNEDLWYENIKKGDVLTFRYTYDNKQETITHRVIDIYKNESGIGYTINLQGDNRDKNDSVAIQTIDTSDENSTNYVIGKVVAKSYFFGLLIYSLKQPIGIVLLVIVPSLIIIILEIIRIINYINEEKKKKIIEEKNKQQDEIEDLKRKLASLEEKSKDL